MSVHYKFKNTKDYDAVKFDGVYISTSELKSIIIQQKKLGNSELQVENEETKEIYTDDKSIPKNTNVIVSRIPFANSNKRARTTGPGGAHQHYNNHHNHNNNNHHHHHHHNNNRHQTASTSSASAHSSTSDQNGSYGAGREALELVSTKNMSEDERIKYIQFQSTKEFDPARYPKSGRGGNRHGGGRGRMFISPGYTCRKCGIQGHSIYDCKINIHKPKRSSGIPRDFLMKVDSKEKGALMTPSGEYAVPFIDHEAYNNPKVEKAPFFEDGTPND